MGGHASLTNTYLDPEDGVSHFVITALSFEKPLWGPGEIKINPYRLILLLYAVVSLDGVVFVGWASGSRLSYHGELLHLRVVVVVVRRSL